MPQETNLVDPDEVHATSAKSLAKLLLDASIVLTISTALLFLLGWSFLDSYYGTFGVSPWALELPPYAALVASASLIPGSTFSVILVFMCLGLMWFAVEAIIGTWQVSRYALYRLESKLGIEVLPRPPSLIKRCAMYIAVGCVVSLILTGLMNIARDLGESAAYKAYEKPTTKIRLVFRSEERVDKKDLLESDLLNANSEGKLMLLVETRDLLVVFVRPMIPKSPVKPKVSQGQPVQMNAVDLMLHPEHPNTFVIPRSIVLSEHNEVQPQIDELITPSAR